MRLKQGVLVRGGLDGALGQLSFFFSLLKSLRVQRMLLKFAHWHSVRTQLGCRFIRYHGMCY